MHFRTHAKPESLGQSGRWQSEYHDVMIDHDKFVGELLDYLDALGITNNTIVQYSTDNGPHRNSWPDAGTTPFRSEKVHLDGYNFLPYFKGEVKKSPRIEFFYFSDDGDLMALRYDNWKTVFMEQREKGTCQIWAEPFVVLRVPKLFNLRTDPYEYADITSNTYWDWMFDHIPLVLAAQPIVAQQFSF
jgi:arylsulfatase A-like enzyme